MILKLFIISVIWVLILDLCGFAHTIDKLLYKIFYSKRAFREDAHFPPLDCSMCMTWWSGLIYLLITGSCNLLMIAILLLFAWLTTIEKDILNLGKDIIIRIIDCLYSELKL